MYYSNSINSTITVFSCLCYWYMSSMASHTSSSEKKQSAQEELDPLVFLKECKETATMKGEVKKAQQIRTLIWKIQDMSDHASRKSEINDMLAEAGLIERKAETNITVSGAASDPSWTEKSIKTTEKKLKDIDKLKLKQKNGTKLEHNQLEKIQREQELLEELESLKAIVASVDNDTV